MPYFVHPKQILKRKLWLSKLLRSSYSPCRATEGAPAVCIAGPWVQSAPEDDRSPSGGRCHACSKRRRWRFSTIKTPVINRLVRHWIELKSKFQAKILAHTHKHNLCVEAAAATNFLPPPIDASFSPARVARLF